MNPIQTEHLSKTFRNVEAVEDLTLSVPQGAVFALVGANGAGKTTTIKTLMNIYRPASGRAEVLGSDSRKLGPKQLAQIGYVSENQQLPDWMRVGYFLSYCKPFYPTWDDGLAANLIRQHELPLDSKLKALSRGMRVKASLVAALAFRPRLIVLDEPFSGLDALVRDELIESVLEMASDATVLLASHDLAEIESFASHIGYLEHGHLQFTEDITSLSERFREVEVTLENPSGIPRDWPSHWLNPEQISVVVRFTDSAFRPEESEAGIQARFPGVRSISARKLPLRSIFVALAKAGRKGR
jgi:ABC-2 type transport system ATP-binding protein